MGRSERNIFTRISQKKEIGERIQYLLYQKEIIDTNDANYLYTVALIFIEEYEKSLKSDSPKKLYIEYAYFIISKTSIKTKQFQALYDFSINYGFYPIAKKITALGLLSQESVGSFLVDLAMDRYEESGIVKTFEQDKIFNEVLMDDNSAVTFLAPTSYGKSELIFKHLKQHNEKSNVAIIVPTKALIDQVYREAKKHVDDRKLIIYDQSYKRESDFRVLAIVTQERALRLLEEDVVFDIIYVDEAHELLNFDFRNNLDNRSLLLGRFIRLARAKNSNLEEIYLSPVIKDSKSLEISNSKKISHHKIYNDLKILDIKYLGEAGIEEIYDKYLGNFIETGKSYSHFDYVVEKSKSKNLHFLHRPIYIEKYSELLANVVPKEMMPRHINDLVDELRDLVHPKFKLARYLELGIVYIHARIPQLIKNYVLKFVREDDFIKHFVANSVVLAGINLPIDNLFYISGYSNIPDLYNLIGRVNRMNEIFKSSNLDIGKIFVPVHFLEISEFPQNQKGSLRNKIRSLRDDYQDEVKNPILDMAKVSSKNREKADSIVETEKAVVLKYSNPDFETELILSGTQQILNYTNLGLMKLEERIRNLKLRENEMKHILDLIKEVFFDEFTERDFKPLPNANRLNNQETIKYYKMFIDNLNKYQLKTRVENIYKYWQNLEEKDYQIYVGTQFGEVVRETNDYEYGRKVYVNLLDHLNDDDYLYNLAIVKLQTDEDFLSHEISLLLNTMLKFEIITQDQYDKYIYGTDVEAEINVLKSGLSRTIYRKLKKDGMLKHLEVDMYGNLKCDEFLLHYIKKLKGIEKFELEQFFL